MLDLHPRERQSATDVVDATTATLGPWLTFAIAVVIAIVAALVLTMIVSGIVKLALRRRA